VAPRHPWLCECWHSSNSCLPALAPAWPSPIQSTTPRPYDTLELMYKASWGLGCPFFYKLRAFVERDRWRCPPPRTTAWLCHARIMPQATRRSFQNIFARQPSPQVALLARIALHRSAPRSLKSQAACQGRLQAQRLHNSRPNQAKDTNAEQGPGIQ
jgi:hypothetical protein